MKLLILLPVLMLCEAKIPVPGLENVGKCKFDDQVCINTRADKITKTLSQPFPPYSIEGYDPFTLKKLDITNSEYRIDQTFTDFVVSGFGDTKIVDLHVEPTNIKVTYRHDYRFSGNVKVVYHTEPEVVREGPLSGSVSGVLSHYQYPINKETRDGKDFIVIGQEKYVAITIPNNPEFNAKEYAHFICEPSTKELQDKVKKQPLGFYKPLVEGVVKAVVPQIFQDSRNFYKHVPLNDLVIE